MTLPRDREHDLDRLLEDDGGELGALYRRLPRMDPPRRLDRSVLGEAARAVQGQVPRRHRWVVGFGTAAGVVLAAGIAWHVGQNALQEQSHDAHRSAPSVVPVEPITESLLRKHERSDAAQNAAASQAAPPAAASVPAPAAKPALARKAAPKPPPAAAVAPEAEPPPAPMASPAPQQPTAFPAETERRAESPAPPATAGAIAPSDKALEAKTPPASDALDQAMPNRFRTNSPPAPSGSVELRRDMQLAPDAWLAHIGQLLHQGRRQQAIDSLRLFRRMHPAEAVPPELRALED
jgi:hypothetical protein